MPRFSRIAVGTVALAMLGGGFSGLMGTHLMIDGLYRWWCRRGGR
jgi:hypothetical protein